VNDSSLSESKDLSKDEFPVSIRSSGENTRGSNPTDGCVGYTHVGEGPTPGANFFTYCLD